MALRAASLISWGTMTGHTAIAVAVNEFLGERCRVEAQFVVHRRVVVHHQTLHRVGNRANRLDCGNIESFALGEDEARFETSCGLR